MLHNVVPALFDRHQRLSVLGRAAYHRYGEHQNDRRQLHCHSALCDRTSRVTPCSFRSPWVAGTRVLITRPRRHFAPCLTVLTPFVARILRNAAGRRRRCRVPLGEGMEAGQMMARQQQMTAVQAKRRMSSEDIPSGEDMAATEEKTMGQMRALWSGGGRMRSWRRSPKSLGRWMMLW
jgi:hypothetical protein